MRCRCLGNADLSFLAALLSFFRTSRGRKNPLLLQKKLAPCQTNKYAFPKCPVIRVSVGKTARGSPCSVRPMSLLCKGFGGRSLLVHERKKGAAQGERWPCACVPGPCVGCSPSPHARENKESVSKKRPLRFARYQERCGANSPCSTTCNTGNAPDVLL